MSNEDLLPDSALERIDSLVASIDQADDQGYDVTDAVSVHFLRNFTIDPIEPYLKFHIMRDALRPTITFGGYDSVVQEILADDSVLRDPDESPDILVVALDLAALDPACSDPEWSADLAIERMQQMFDAVRERTLCVAVVNTLLPVLLVDGSAVDASGALALEIERANNWIGDYADANRGRFVAVDWQQLLDGVGRTESIDARFWRTSMAPFRGVFLERYANHIARIARALKGKAKKCLVLDCDDTLWGGVVGEDGLDGIRLGGREGAPYVEFQQAIVDLQKRGVLVALCSKNNPEDVWEVLDGHPRSVLQRLHLSAWRINWDDKAGNIAALGEELNLPLDSFVVVDDNPRECQLIREFLPEVTVLQVPDDLADYAGLITRDGLFDALSVSEEDRHRSQRYREEHERAQTRTSHATVDEYLASLHQVLRIWQAGPDDLARVTQLTQKTNQFNLTTQRYSEGQVAAFMDNDQSAVYAMSVSDRYGELGTTGVLIAQRDGNVARIDTLLLSCRVLGRQLEFAFVDRCLAAIEQDWGVAQWCAEYRPTRKNAQVADFWERVGFSVHASTDSMTSYERPAGQGRDNYSNVMTIEEA